MERPRSPVATSPEPAQELERDRAFEAHGAAGLGHLLRRRGIAEHELRRVAGDEADQDEDGGRDEEQRRERQQEPAQDVGRPSALPLPLAGRGPSPPGG